MYKFSYQAASSVEDAVKRMHADPDAKILAGGMTLLPTMKLRLANPSELIDVTTIGGLNEIKVSEHSVLIGATAKHREVATDPNVAKHLPALAQLANGIGDAQVRNRGTIGGSVANNDPAADYPAAVLGLGATVKTNKREVAADSFFTDMFETALDDDEIIIAIDFPIPDFANYQKFPNPASRYAIVGVFLAKFGEQVRVAVTGAGACVFRFDAAERALEKNFSATAVEHLSFDPEDLNEDLHASAAYRANLISVLTKRAVNAE